MSKVKELNELASKMVGDGKKKNVFFVCDNGNTVMVTTQFHFAYSLWNHMKNINVVSTLEDRQTGVICSAGPEYDENGKRVGGWEVLDQSRYFGFRS